MARTATQQVTADSRPQVLEATLRVIVAGGVDAVRYRSVADEAGVSLGTVSYHYPSREELLRAALTHYLDESVRELLALRDAYRTPRLDDVADYVVEVVRRDFADPCRGIIAEYELMVYAARDPEVAKALRLYEDSLVAEMARSLEALGAKSPFAVARTLAELIRGFELTRLASENRDLEDFRKRVSAVLTAFGVESAKPRNRGSYAKKKSR